MREIVDFVPTRRTMLAGIAAMVGSRRALAANSTWEAIGDSGVVRFGVLQKHAPYHNFEDGKWVGFAIRMGLDCMQALSAAMQKPLRPEYVETTLGTVILDIQANRLDLYFGLTASEERRRAISLFGPIYELPECAINTQGFDPGDSWADYDKPSVAVSVVMGSTDEQAARKMLPHADIRALKSTAEAILDIQSGNSKAMINTVLSGMMAARQTPNLGPPVVLQPLLSQPSMGGTRRDGDGKFAAFCEEWAKQYRASGQAKQAILEAMQHSGLDASKLPPTLQF
ncbi:MAG: transporter substrate-binding domain-containing protein [Acidisphaera sp.]|nr:transporter substrate-binding domain-containing protein [Acidisphaera sp.]